MRPPDSPERTMQAQHHPKALRSEGDPPTYQYRKLQTFGVWCLNRRWLRAAELAFRLCITRIPQDESVKWLLELARAYLRHDRGRRALEMFDLCALLTKPFS